MLYFKNYPDQVIVISHSALNYKLYIWFIIRIFSFIKMQYAGILIALCICTVQRPSTDMQVHSFPIDSSCPCNFYIIQFKRFMLM